MIDASAFLSVAGARAAYRRAAPPLRDAHVAALAAGFTRRAAPLGCVVQLFAPASAPADADGLLAGVPLAHKDAFDTGRHAPRLGGPQATGTPRPAAAVLRRLAGHGALNLGALAMAEHACGATAENPHAPALMNPLDSAAAVGGSSSGSAVAVAAGLCPASLGTDTAGSVRMPAATCGLIGLKPTPGRLSAQGVAPLAPTLDTVGVIARDALDAASVFAAALPAGDEDPGLPLRLDALERELARPRDWRIANALHAQGEDPTVAAALTGFEQRLRGAARLKPAALPDLDRLNRLAQIVLHAEAALALAAAVRGDLDTLAPSTRAIALPGWAMPAVWYRHALAQAAPLRAAFLAGSLGDADLLLAPCFPQGVPDRDAVTTSSPAFDPRALAALHRHHAYVNFLGLPALVLPVGLDGRGRPVSAQLIGAPGSEARMLAFARQFALPHSTFLQR